jgi:hypothetical protein
MSAADAPAIATADALRDVVARVVRETPVVDAHTHIYSPAFGSLLLWGVDELVSYHYLIAEVLRTDHSVSPAEFWAMLPEKRAEHIWRGLFVEDAPISEARRGVLTTLARLGIEVGPDSLQKAREYFRDVTVEQHVDTVFRVANVKAAVMTNDPFDPVEREVWENGGQAPISPAPEIGACPLFSPRFKTALRIDLLLNSWDEAVRKLQEWGYAVQPPLDTATCAEVRRFLGEWCDRLKPVYLAVSLPNTFAYPVNDARSKTIRDCILPLCRERGVPFALMVGVKRQVNPDLRLAGDGVGRFDVGVLEGLCAANPDVRFLCTLLSRENQHEFAVAARKFPNLLPFGCWWFLNNPSLILEITRMRLELLGCGFIPQHSDARILDQLIYKWDHSRALIAQVLTEKYADLLATGWPLTEAQVRRDVERLFEGNLRDFTGVEF